MRTVKLKAEAVAIGARIRDQRERLGLSQEALAKAARSNQSRISDYELGLKVPQVPTCRALADALHVSIGWLLDGRKYVKTPVKGATR